MNAHISVNQEKCKACHRCEVACIASHHNMTLKEAMKVKGSYAPRINVIKDGDLKTSVRCHQCDNAPCCSVCPTGALRKTDAGHVISPELCIACEMCIKACPYGAVSLEIISVEELTGSANDVSCALPGRTIAVRCDLCKQWRAKDGKKITACMEACPVRAIVMVESDGTIIEPPAPAKKPVAEKAKKEIE